MAAPKNNDYAMKWKTSKERQALCDAFCRHISQGLSVDSFPDASFKTIQKYIKNYPKDFPSIKIEEARRQGRLIWEKLGLGAAAGKIKNFSSASWIFNMKNRYGWKDKVEIAGDPNAPIEPPKIIIEHVKVDRSDHDE